MLRLFTASNIMRYIVPGFSCVGVNKNSAKKYYMNTRKSQVCLLVRKVGFFYFDIINMGEKWSELLSSI